MTKKELRKVYLQKRSSLVESEYRNLNLSLCDNFFQSVELSSIKVLHTFLPIEKNKEPDTFLIIDRIRKEFPKIRLSVPRVNAVSNSLENFYFEEFEQLKQNSWNILEPQNGVPTEINEIDIVLVPLVAFDETGHRIGYGKGYYDKFLPLCRKDCKKIGLSLFQPVYKIDDIEKHDQKLDVAITPTKTFRF